VRSDLSERFRGRHTDLGLFILERGNQRRYRSFTIIDANLHDLSCRVNTF
jgi:hypothetical protein